MSKPGSETKTTVILKPGELRALMRVGMKLSNGFGMAKTRLLRQAVREFIERNGEVVPREIP